MTPAAKVSVYKLIPDSGYEVCVPSSGLAADYAAVWKANENADRTLMPPRFVGVQFSLSRVRTDNGCQLLPSDSPYLSAGTLLVTEPATRIQSIGLLQRAPIDCRDAKLSVAYVPTLDALDLERSEVRSVDGQVRAIYSHAFVKERLTRSLFRLAVAPHYGFYVLDPFVHEWKSAGLTGLTFDKVWRG